MGKYILIFVVFLVGVSLFYYKYTGKQNQELPPIYNPIDLNPEMVDQDLMRVGFGHKIGEFQFLNQNGETISHKDVEGKIYVAEYFFTTCPTICPVMNKQMQRVQEAYLGNEHFKILSFTVNPEVDDVKQMKNYAEGHHANNNQWWFLTGDKEKLYQLARKSFFVLKPAEAQNLGDAGSDFIHTNNFVLVDQKKQIRGYYDGTNQEEVDKLIRDIAVLLKNQNEFKK